MDSLTIALLCLELDSLLAGARIDKIHQPSDRDIVITLRTRRENVRLFLSANRSAPRAHLMYNARPANPEEPPMFCMFLRKHLEGARVTSVAQHGGDRIVAIHVESKNEIGDVVQFVLLLELMGKHSNVMLCEATMDGMPRRILDSLIHVSPDLSRVRPVLPGFTYTPVPSQQKVPVHEVTRQNLSEMGLGSLGEKERVKALTRSVAGIGPVTAREALYRATHPQTEEPSEPSPPRHGALAADSLEDGVARALRELHHIALTGREGAWLEEDALGRAVAAAPFRLTHAGRAHAAQSLNHALDELHQSSVQIQQTSRLAMDLTKSVLDNVDKLRGKLAKLTQQLESSVNHDELRVMGELLTTYGYKVEKGSMDAVLPNYYDDERPLSIALDPSLSAIENAQRYFKKSSKKKRAIPILTREIAQTKDDIEYLEAVLVHLQDARPDHLEEIRRELAGQGFFKEKQTRPNRDKNSARSKKHKPREAAMPPDEFQSQDGFTIRVGRNNVQNDRLTLRSSQPHDIWLHVKGEPGSHVVIETNRQTVPESTLHDAALLAAFFSKSRDSTNAAVDYAPVKNVWKPNGARPGHVLYEGQRTLFVTPDRALVQQILDRKAP